MKQNKLSSTAIQGGHQLEMTAFFHTREQLAIRITTAGDSIRKVTKNFYTVRSQAGKGWYKVKRLQDADIWTCECADFMYRLSKDVDKKCKHILAVENLQKTSLFGRRIELGPPPARPMLCPKCSSANLIKRGFRVLNDESLRQRYSCLQCKKRFIVREPGFTNIRSSPQMVAEALNLIFSGLSLRQVSRHLSMAHQVNVGHSTLQYWFKKYVMLMREYVDDLNPDYHEVWSVDEMMVNVKKTNPTGIGYYDWMWSIISPTTKYVVATVISKRREISDACVLFQRGKKQQPESDPKYIITDALHGYEEAIRREFDTRRTTAHVKTKSLSDGFANRPIERWHNEVRESLKTKRGLGNDASTQLRADALRMNHNFIRPHSGLSKNTTPAEAAGLDLGLGVNKVMDLIVKSAEGIQERKREYNIELQLGKRLKFVGIKREQDCISVKPDSWIPKSFWREINDILFINGFSWIENGKESQWIKMNRQGAFIPNG